MACTHDHAPTYRGVQCWPTATVLRTYHSTVINAAAVNFLLDSGISVRVDAPRKLLHSKFLVIDSDRTIIGSHNWSAGSCFGFDDLSVDIESATFARSARRRFAALWRDADVASRSGPP